MASIDIKNTRGEVVGNIELDERVFGIEPNRAVLHQAVVTQLANQRRGTHDTKTRGEVRGGGRKPWRQKGTGRARQGSTRAPHWRTGGIVFGPHPRSYHRDLPRKMRRLALRSALSAKVQDGELVVVDQFTLAAAKTKEMVAVLERLGATGSALIVLGEADGAAKRAAANLPKVRTAQPGSTNLLDVLKHRWLLITVDAVESITRTLSADLKATAPAPEPSSAPARRAAGTEATADEASAPPAPASAPPPAASAAE